MQLSCNRQRTLTSGNALAFDRLVVFLVSYPPHNAKEEQHRDDVDVADVQRGVPLGDDVPKHVHVEVCRGEGT